MRKWEPQPDALDRLLAGDGSDGDPAWKERIREEVPPSEVAQHRTRMPVRMGRALNHYSTICAASEGMSRSAWMRQIMAERIEAVLGVPIAESLSDTTADKPRFIKERLTGHG